ncbi:helix-turn-helix domain-containing protein [Polymorphospora lycopeni]|uniref:Helix-turn-helix domain-containing protein n=1 Tax=Polymorphospora lycopeni TaxID=3140240 RepID=A0ABV5CKX9_9ACTN
MADGQGWLIVSKAAEMLGGVDPQTVRRYIADDLLHAVRLPKGHRRVDPASVRELLEASAMAPGPDREKAFEELRARNSVKNGGGSPAE